MTRVLWISALCILSLAFLGCDSDDILDDLDTDMNWVLKDQCPDGLGLQARFFDMDNGRVWPSTSQVYFASPGEEVDVILRCEIGNQICYGARPDPDDGTFWGVDLDGDAGCADCCEPCTGVLTEFNLGC